MLCHKAGCYPYSSIQTTVRTMLESKQVKQNNSLESDVGGESDTKEKNYQDLTFFFLPIS